MQAYILFVQYDKYESDFIGLADSVETAKVICEHHYAYYVSESESLDWQEIRPNHWVADMDYKYVIGESTEIQTMETLKDLSYAL